MIQTTMGVLVQADAALQRLAEVKVAAKPGYHLAKLVALVRQELAHFEKERAALIRRLGSERPATQAEVATMGPTVLQVAPEKGPEFMQAIDELAAIEVSIDWNPFDLAALNGEAILSAEDLRRLGPLVTYSES